MIIINNFKYCKIEIFIPKDYLNKLCKVLSDMDVGHIGNYDNCLSYSNVIGRWRSLEGTNPFIGEIGKISEEEEVKVETTLPTENVYMVIKAIKNIHPYEEPVINVIPLYMTGLDV